MERQLELSAPLSLGSPPPAGVGGWGCVPGALRWGQGDIAAFKEKIWGEKRKVGPREQGSIAGTPVPLKLREGVILCCARLLLPGAALKIGWG